MSFPLCISVAMGCYLCAAILSVMGWRRPVLIALLAGIGCNLSTLARRGFVAGAWYPDLALAEVYLLPAVLAAIAGAFHCTRQMRGTRIILIPLAFAALLVLAMPKPEAIPTIRTLSLWTPFFFLTETIGVALFIAAGSLAAATWVFGDDTPPYQPLVTWGFITFTLCQILGAVWAYLGWSSPFSWEYRHLVSAAVWCLYAAVLHADTAGISPRVKAVCTALGIIPCIYLGCFYDIAAALNRLMGLFA